MPTARKQAHKKNWGADTQHGVERKSDLGNTNTPEDVAWMIVSKVLQGHAPQPHERWLEPAVGAGNFYLAVLKWHAMQGVDPLDVARRFDAVDIDEDALKVLKQRLKDTYGWSEAVIHALPLHHTSLLTFKPEGLYDFVITNPPFLAPKNWHQDPAQREKMFQAWQALVPQAAKRADLFVYFFHWAHKHLKEGGQSIFLCSDGWLDSGYGESLRQEILSPSFALTQVVSWPWKALFRDDTCPVLTVVQKLSPTTPKTLTRLEIHDTNPLAETGTSEAMACYRGTFAQPMISEVLLTQDDLEAWWSEQTINRRQRMVTDASTYDALDGALQKHQTHMTALKDLLELTTFSWSMQDLIRHQIAHEKKAGEAKEETYSVFFQPQARVGKPVDYRQFRTTASLGFEVTLGTDAWSSKIKKSGLREGGVWISQAIDRFPLIFTQAPNDAKASWVGVSKYIHGALLDKHAPQAWATDDVMVALMTSTPALLSFERVMKEGTRKTLRVDENGYAKEITKSDLQHLSIPSPNLLSEEDLTRLRKHQAKRGVVSLMRVDDAVQNEDWKEIDRIIMSAMGIDDQEQTRLQNMLKALYWRRMRNLNTYAQALKDFQNS